MGKRKALLNDEPVERASKATRTRVDPAPSKLVSRPPRRRLLEISKVKQRTAKAPTAPTSTVTLNTAPVERLDVYVFGGNSGGELGLGRDATSGCVKRPRLSPNLLADIIGVVEIAAGGMHCIALTYDNKILTWGVNDLGALGRDTTWDGGLVDMVDGADEEEDSDDEGGKLNPKEATPTSLNSSAFPQGTMFAQVAASDNASFVLTTNGFVYGWGTFNATDGTHAFSPATSLQLRPALIANLRKVIKLASGTNHVLALTSDGSVLSWGFGEQSQLGRRVLSRNRFNALLARPTGLSNITNIGSGADHSFAIDRVGTVFSWGLNNYGQTGIWDNIGDDNATIDRPTVVTGLKSYNNITIITGGNHHTIAATSEGLCLAYGRADTSALGIDASKLPSDDTVKDHRDRPRILKVPTPVPGFVVSFVAAGSDHSIAVTKDGKAYSWGFSASYQTGQGTDDDVDTPTLLDNTAVRGKSLVWAGAGGQYSVLAAKPPGQVNGTS